jgi:hypothetical protein
VAAAEDRSTRDPREERRLARKLVDRVFFVRAIEIDSTMLDEPSDPLRNGQQQRFHLRFARLLAYAFESTPFGSRDNAWSLSACCTHA